MTSKSECIVTSFHDSIPGKISNSRKSKAALLFFFLMCYKYTSESEERHSRTVFSHSSMSLKNFVNYLSFQQTISKHLLLFHAIY